MLQKGKIINAANILMPGLLTAFQFFCTGENSLHTDIKSLDTEIAISFPDIKPDLNKIEIIGNEAEDSYEEIAEKDEIEYSDIKTDSDIFNDFLEQTEIQYDQGYDLPKDQGFELIKDIIADQAADIIKDQTQACTQNSCQKGYWCNLGNCVQCGNDDPDHCGSGCFKCGDILPYCVNGACACKNDKDCGTGKFCNMNGKCESCMTDEHCGPECMPCVSPTPICKAGEKCVGCFKDEDCTKGNFCDGTMCVPCNDIDPLHCGTECINCGEYHKCEGGSCVLCDKPENCGKACLPCPNELPFCYPATHECSQCLDDNACEEKDHCENGTCVPDCSVQGCLTDKKPDGEKCSTAIIIGRKEAKTGFVMNSDTSDDWDNDQVSASDCWDANNDNFYRIYLVKGETLNVKMDPYDFDCSVKLYSGTKCEAGGDNPLICEDNTGYGSVEKISNYVAAKDGWHTIVADGETAFDDYGTYKIEVSLACLQPECCCP
jgi:hypothetical protein